VTIEHTPLDNAVLLPYSRIRPNPDQPRQYFDETTLEELRDSIRVHGLQQPIIVRYEPSRYDGTPYIIIAGERRFRACEGVLEMVPCIIHNVEDAIASELALVENIQRQDLTALEEAKAVRKLMTAQNLSISRVAKRLGVSQGWVTNRLALLKTGDDIQQVAALAPKAMSSLLLVDKVKDKELRSELLSEVIAEKPHSQIKARVEAHESAIEAQKKAEAAANRAPDTETTVRLISRGKGEGSSISRGRLVKSNSQAEAKVEVQRAIANVIAWTPLLSDEDFEKLIKPFARRLIRGDLAR
jgi:ParB family chromosome partitioning protein